MAAAMAARKVERPSFEGGEIPDLLAYIRSTGGGTERLYAPPGNPRRGEALFSSKHCVECHAVRGHGGTVGPDLARELRGTLMQIAGAMWNHGPRMWSRMAERGLAVPSLSTEEMSDLVSYLYFFQFLDAPGNARRGAAVLREKRCGSCHGPAGASPAAPPFAAIAEQLRTPLAVITAMWNHAGRMTEVMAAENVAWPMLKGGEIADLVAYVLATPDGAGRTAGAPRPGSPGAAERSAERKSTLVKGKGNR